MWVEKGTGRGNGTGRDEVQVCILKVKTKRASSSIYQLYNALSLVFFDDIEHRF